MRSVHFPADLRLAKVIGILRNGRSESPGTGDRNRLEQVIEIGGIRTAFLLPDEELAAFGHPAANTVDAWAAAVTAFARPLKR